MVVKTAKSGDKRKHNRPPPNPNGRPKGVPNKTTTALKEAILLAAEQVGYDKQGKDGLTGYLRRVAIEDVKAFSGLLGKVLPLQLANADDAALKISVVERVIVKAKD